MLRRIFSTLLFVGICSSLLGVVSAQDVSEVDATLQDVTSNTTTYYDETVTVEGVIVEYLNASSFILGESTDMNDNRVLVLNNSGDVFSPELFVGDSVIVTGIVHGSRQTYQDNLAEGDSVGDVVDPMNSMDAVTMRGDSQQLKGAKDRNKNNESMDSSNATTNGDMANTSLIDPVGANITVNMFDFYLEGHYPEEYDNYTIIEVQDVLGIQHKSLDNQD